MLLASKGRSQTVKSYVAKITKEDLLYLGGLLQTGKVKAVIDKRYALSETSEALAYLGDGHARGKIVITM
jgi:NADPH:quinone reductase-like Zn-dependent oxidoreductase